MAQGLFLQQRHLMPPVRKPAGMGQHQQGTEAVRRTSQQHPAFGNSLPVTTQQGQRPNPLYARLLPQPGAHCLPVHDHIPKRHRIRAPDLCERNRQPAAVYEDTGRDQLPTQRHHHPKIPHPNSPLAFEWSVACGLLLRRRSDPRLGHRSSAAETRTNQGPWFPAPPTPAVLRPNDAPPPHGITRREDTALAAV